MKKKIKPELVGGFVVGSIALLILYIVIFGSGQMFRKKTEFILVFDQSVNGLDMGAPVKFRGVEIGSVRNIQLNIEGKLDGPSIPVYIEIDRSRMGGELGAQADISDRKVIDAFIAQGMRAQLKSQSLLTGKLYVDLDVYSDKPAEFRVPKGASSLQEIPTIPTPFDEIAKSAEDVVKNINKVLAKLDLQIDPVAQNLNQVLAEATLAFQKINAVAVDVDGILGSDSQVAYQLPKTLEEISKAATSVKAFADYLERNPNALLVGKKGD
jgi:paraquat-inducible protein B